jgi:hypothetical protein
VVVPEAVGIPVMHPVEALKLRPDGKALPIEENVLGFTPPVTERQKLYAVPTNASVRLVVLNTSGAGLSAPKKLA